MLGGTDTPEPGIPASPNQITEGEGRTLPPTNENSPSDVNQSEGGGTGKEVPSQVANENDTITSSLANETAETAYQELPEISIQSEIPESEITSSAANQSQNEEILTSSSPNQIGEKQEEDEFGDFQEAKAEVVASQDSAVSETPTRDDHLPEPMTAKDTQEREEGLGGEEEAGNSHESGAAVISGGEGMSGESVASAINIHAHYK